MPHLGMKTVKKDRLTRVTPLDSRRTSCHPKLQVLSIRQVGTAQMTVEEEGQQVAWL